MTDRQTALSMPPATLAPRQFTAVQIPGAADQVQPWEIPAPPLLFKYYPPERFHVLTDCAVRFSQRQVLRDPQEFKPEIESFGPIDEMRAFMAADPFFQQNYSEQAKEQFIQYAIRHPEHSAAMINQTDKYLTAPDEFAIFCLSDTPRSRRMWNDYAGGGHGFVIAFNTTHPSFIDLTRPGRLGKVAYSDEPLKSFLSSYGTAAFFRKTTAYQYESEWRSIRALKRFTLTISPEGVPTVYLSPFDPACIAGILIQSECAIEWELRILAATDWRYRNVPIGIPDY
jgi:hypothetical protein